jgi:hypothetical protein
VRYLVTLVAAIAATSVSAQPPQPVAAAEAVQPIDPARLSLARTTVAAIWPLGTYARIMQGSLSGMMDSIMASMFDMTAEDLAKVASPEGKASPSGEAGKQTMREFIAASDPHFEERMKITNRVMMDVMTPIMARLEPQMREGMARAYARKFTASQLEELNQFFATPTGRYYGAESLMLWTDPEFVAQIGAFMPEFLKQMPSLAEKLKAATAHLPPPPKVDDGTEADGSEEESDGRIET